MATSYDIYYSGKLAEGFDRATVAQNLEKLFKADAATVEKLLSGQPQRLKGGLDKAAALKYKKAMESAGAVPDIRMNAAAETAGAESPQAADAPPAATVAAAAEAAPESPAADEPGAEAQPATPALADGGMSLAPVGSDVLREEERKEVDAVEVDTSAIQMESPFMTEDPAPAEPPPPAPDTSHLSTAEVGEDIPNLPSEVEELDPDTSYMDLAPEGADFREVAPEEAPPLPAPDTSHFDLAPEGSDVLEEQYRDGPPPAAPDTGHIQLEEPLA